MAIPRAALLLALFVLCARGARAAAAEGEAGALSGDCEAQLDAMWDLYRNPKYTLEGCDASCLGACYETLEEAVYTTYVKDCPRQDDITRCFGYYVPQWEEYIAACDLFTVSTSEMPAGATGESEAGSPSSSSGEAEGEAEAPATEANATATAAAAAAAPPAPEGEGEAEAEAEAPAASANGTAEAEAEAPAASANGTAEAETAADADAEAEAEADAGRRLLAEAEAESEGAETSGAGICFPSFHSTDEFSMYLRGDYFTLAYDPPSDTAGIIMSVFFWVGLAGMGLYLRK